MVTAALGDRFRRVLGYWQPGQPRGQAAVDEAKGLPGCSGDERGDDVCSVPVQAGAGSVIPHGGARVGVGGGLLHVTQRHPGVERGGNKCMSQSVRADVLGDLGAAGNPADDSGSAVPVQPPAVRGEEQRPFGPLADSQVDRPCGPRCERDGDDLAAFAGDDQGAVAAFQA